MRIRPETPADRPAIAARPEHQRRGMGSALVRAALHEADVRGEPIVLLEGNPAYYRRFDFRTASQLGLERPHGVPDHVFMARPLRAYDPSLAGRVVYPPAFETGS